jgi:tetratricopeptide (TPR) repeat protein
VRPPSIGRATPEQLYQWATERLKAGRCYRRAAELLEQAVAARPGEPRYREALACAYLDRSLVISTWRRRQALGSVEPPPASQPGTPLPQPEALDAEARAAALKALVEVREATRLAPDDAEVHHTRGWILTLALQFQIPDVKLEDGLAALETAVRLSPKEARYHRSLGDVLFMQTPLRDGFEMPPPAPGSPPPRISPEVFRRLMPGPSPDQKARWRTARGRMLEAYQQAVGLRPSDDSCITGFMGCLPPSSPSSLHRQGSIWKRRGVSYPPMRS